jgi:hypothetical protein
MKVILQKFNNRPNVQGIPSSLQNPKVYRRVQDPATGP